MLHKKFNLELYHIIIQILINLVLIYIYSYMLSVKIVGGDFYNFFLTKENEATFFTVCLLHTFYSRFTYLSITDVFNTLCKS